MLCNDFLHVSTIDLFSELLHGENDILSGNFTRLVCVELVEYNLETRLRQKARNVNRSRQKLTVVYDLVAMIVHLGDHFLNFCLTYVAVHASLLQN